jgi:hypothetical protein
VTLYSTILTYQGYQINVENWIYWLAVNPDKKFLSMNEAKAEVDRIEKDFQTTMKSV